MSNSHIDQNQLISEIINALVPNLKENSTTMRRYETMNAKMTAAFASALADDLNNHRLDEDEAADLLKHQESVQKTYVLARDCIRQSNEQKTVNAVMRVVQGAINTATGLSLKVF
jgi:hypothetical protein